MQPVTRAMIAPSSHLLPLAPAQFTSPASPSRPHHVVPPAPYFALLPLLLPQHNEQTEISMEKGRVMCVFYLHYNGDPFLTVYACPLSYQEMEFAILAHAHQSLHVTQHGAQRSVFLHQSLDTAH